MGGREYSLITERVAKERSSLCLLNVIKMLQRCVFRVIL